MGMRIMRNVTAGPDIEQNAINKALKSADESKYKKMQEKLADEDTGDGAFDKLGRYAKTDEGYGMISQLSGMLNDAQDAGVDKADAFSRIMGYGGVSKNAPKMTAMDRLQRDKLYKRAEERKQSRYEDMLANLGVNKEKKKEKK